MIDLQNAKGRNFIITLFVIFLVVIKLDSFVAYFHKIVQVTAPFLIGIVIAFLLNRPMLTFESLLSRKITFKHKKMLRMLSITVVYCGFILIILSFFSFVVPELISSITRFFSNSDSYFNNLSELLIAIENKFQIFDNFEISELVGYIKDFVTTSWNIVAPKLLDITRTLFSSVFTSLIAIIFSIYLLASREEIFSLINRIAQAYMSETVYKKSMAITKIVIDVFNKYVVGQILEAFILGTLCFIGMLIFRFDYALLISSVIAVTALIPLFGAFIGGGIAVLLLLMISPTKAFFFLVYLIILQQVESNLIYPHVVGNQLGLPPILVMFSVIVGGNIFGFAGMLIGVPIATILYILSKQQLAVEEKKHEAIDTRE